MTDWYWKEYLQKICTEESKIVLAILADLNNRRGLSHEWENIDSDIQKEIIDKWHALVKEHLTPAQEE